MYQCISTPLLIQVLKKRGLDPFTVRILNSDYASNTTTFCISLDRDIVRTFPVKLNVDLALVLSDLDAHYGVSGEVFGVSFYWSKIVITMSLEVYV